MSLGTFVIITGPSGAGKTTVVEHLLQRFPKSTRLVTMTTRQPRPHEKEGRDYYFISRAEFEERRDRGEFFEWDEHYGELYGSSQMKLNQLLSQHPIVFAIIDVNGATSIKEMMPNAFIIFLDVPKIEQLRERLIARKMPDDTLNRRLDIADHERKRASLFHAVVINSNEHLKSAVEECVALISKGQATS